MNRWAAAIWLFSAAGVILLAQPPGRLVDVNGRKLYLHCTGTGSPTVVLVAGGEAFSIDWALVQQVSRRKRVFAPTIARDWAGASQARRTKPSSRP